MVLRLITFILLSSNYLYGQSSNYDDLMIYHADQNFKKLIKTAKKYCKQKESKNDPLPHLWLGKAYLSIALPKKNMDSADYRTNLEMSISEYNTSLTLDYNQRAQRNYAHFYTDIKQVINDEIFQSLNTQTNTLYWIEAYKKTTSNPMAINYINAVYLRLKQDSILADQIANTTTENFPSEIDIKHWDSEDLRILQQGVLRNLIYYKESNQIDKANDLILKAKYCFSNEVDLKSILQE